MRSTVELREGFQAFFEDKGHLRVPSASLVPRADDHSTLLTTAGMQPQMPYFLGREDPPAPLTVTVQKCFRTPDIDEVGLDGSHLTFFEMLGNFSFGQYFKEGAIELATEFVREHMRLDWDRVWATVHAGDPQFGLGPRRGHDRPLGEDRHASRSASSRSRRPRTSGRSEARGRAVRTRSSTTTGARRRAAASRTARPVARAASASSSSGTSSSWSSSSTPTAR